MTFKVALSFVNKLREFESVLQSQKTNNIKSQSILPEYKTFKQKESFIDSFSSENSFCLMQLGFDFSTTFSSNIIQVRSCSEDYMVYKFVYEIIQTILLQSEKNPIFLQFTTTFLSSVHLLQQQKQLVSYCIYPKEFQHLKLLLNQDSKTICLSSMCQQTETIVNEIKSLVISENNVTKLDLMLLLTQHVHWYYNIIWNIFNSSQKFNGILVEYLLWFHNIYTDNFKRRVVECIENMKCILKKKSLRESDIEYGVYGIVSIEELLPLTKHLLFILLLQSDSGFLLSNQIFHMARCDTDQDILMMFIYLHDIHPINISVWSSTKLIAFQNICQTSRCNIEKNQQIDINHHHTILHKSENLFS
ncbi:hypothetical protein LOTGIDRAFT_166903 [Lottia gigantea]|uniref:Uncharacterized protein n=1 Tax=Lottia gigantea TaxID=225164 RepID=V3ZVK6_LOTGI|nr:hypothetical protein LOTGIDRAFT_166903 [Lottia gigantea]ESO86635.1 hypothetical protein LOTGIDRAFT_166903 [Lottia gigantea]